MPPGGLWTGSGPAGRGGQGTSPRTRPLPHLSGPQVRTRQGVVCVLTAGCRGLGPVLWASWGSQRRHGVGTLDERKRGEGVQLPELSGWGVFFMSQGPRPGQWGDVLAEVAAVRDGS